MIRILPTLVAVLPLVASGFLAEYLWRRKQLRGEGGRKFIHIIFGVWIAFWTYLISREEIIILCFVMLLILLLSRVLPQIHVGFDVPRKTFGQYIYPISIALISFLSKERWQFVVPVLVLAIPDGIAAIVGTRYSKLAREYKLLGRTKSVWGTCAYALFLFAILVVFKFTVMHNLGWDLICLLIIGVTALENLLPLGLDNIVIPVALLLVLQAVLG